MHRGLLFTREFLKRGIVETATWAALTDSEVDRFRVTARSIFTRFPVAGRGGAAPTAAALAGRGGQGRPHDHPYRRCFRGWRRWLLAGALATGARRRSLRHSPDERGRAPRASAGEDGPARHRIAEASISRLAARRTEPLQHGRDPDDRGRGCQAAESRAREPRRRAHAHCEPDEGCPGPPRHPELQADVVQGAGASRDAADARRRTLATEHARRAATRYGAAARCGESDQGDRGGAPGTAGTAT